MKQTGCHFEILSHDANGYVVRCTDCGYYQLAFGTITLSLQPQAIAEFYRHLQQAKTESAGDPFPHQKTIRLQVGASHIRMALSPEEAGQLQRLLDEAAATVHFLQLMKEVKCR